MDAMQCDVLRGVGVGVCLVGAAGQLDTTNRYSFDTISFLSRCWLSQPQLPLCLRRNVRGSGETVEHTYTVAALKKGFTRMDRAVVNYKFNNENGEEQVRTCSDGRCIGESVFRLWCGLYLHVRLRTHSTLCMCWYACYNMLRSICIA